MSAVLTPEINDLKLQLVHKLEKRVLAYTKTAKFEKAISGANLIISCLPTSSRGYLLAGNIYEEQGKVHEARRMYQDCCRKLAFLDDGYRKVKNKPQASSYSGPFFRGARPNILHPLPVEVIHILLSFLPFESRIICSQVCKQWQRMIFQIASVWHNMNVKKP